VNRSASAALPGLPYPFPEKILMPLFFPRVAAMIDCLIVLLVFALMIFILSGTSPVRGELPPPRRSVPLAASSGPSPSGAPASADENAPAPPRQAQTGNLPSEEWPETDRRPADDEPKDCGAFPERPADDPADNGLCAYLSRAIEHSETCANLQQSGPKRRSGKRSAVWLTRAQNLKAEQGLRCAGDGDGDGE
jgi:hypothetical protein